MAVRLILAFTLLFLAAFAVRAEDHRPVPAAFAIDGSSHTFVRVSINGAREVWMLLDTGTTPSTIDADYARSLGLTLGRVRNIGKGVGGDTIPIASVKVAALRIGDTRRAGVAFEAMPFVILAPNGEKALGVIGHSALSGRTLVIDYPRRQVFLSEKSGLGACHCGAPFRLRYDIPTIPIALGGRRTEALIDTGGSYEVLVTPKAAPGLGLQEAMTTGQAGHGRGYGGAQAMRSGKGPALQVGEKIKPTSDIAFVNLPIKVDAALGTWFLRDYRVTVDYRARRVLFERPDVTTAPRTP